MILLNGSNIKKMFLDETLLTVYRLMLTVTIKSDFISVNGAGKSTLLK